MVDDAAFGFVSGVPGHVTSAIFERDILVARFVAIFVAITLLKHRNEQHFY